MGSGVSKCEWRHAPEKRRGFGDFLKSQLVELRPASREDDWLSLARGGLGQVSQEMGECRWKSQNRKNVYLSPYVEEPLNSKVIKSFVPELRSRYVFLEFRDSYVYMIWTVYVRFAHGRIWLWYIYIHEWINSQAHEVYIYHIYPTPPLGQDMTQGHFYKRSLTGLNSFS